MKDQSKTKQTLIQELASLKQRIEELEQSESVRKRVEETLRESEGRYRRIAENMSDIVSEVDAQGIIRYASPSYKKVFGEIQHEVIGRSAFDSIHPEDQDRVAAEYMEGVRTKTAREVEYRVRHADGHYIWLRSFGHSFFGAAGELLGMIVTSRDITERKQTEDELRESEEKYRTLVENASDIVFRTDENGNFTFVNPAVSRITGYTAEELIGKRYTIIMRPDMCDASIKFYGRQFVKRLQNTYAEYPIIAKDGHELWFGQNTQLIVKDSHVSGFQVVARDISAQKQAEEALRDSEKLYRSLIECSSDAIFCVDEKGQYQFVNTIFATTFGKFPEYFKGKTFWDIYPKEHADYRYAATQRVIQTGESESIEVEVPLPDKALFFYATANPIKDETGKVVMVLTHAVNITERKRTEESLRQSEERMRLFFERQLVGMAITSPEKGWLQVNKRLSEMLGYLPEELSLQTWAELTHPDDLAADVAQFNRLLSGEIDQYFLEKRFIRKDGAVINTNLSVGCVRRQDGSVDYVLALLEDITAQKRIEEVLRDIEARYALIMNNITDRIWLTDMNFRILWASDSVASNRGYQLEEINPLPFEKLLTPDSLETAIRAISEELTPQRLQQKDLDISKTLELEFFRKDNSIFWSEVTMRVLRDHDGTPNSILGVGRDVTARKQAEEALRESEQRYRLITENMADVVSVLDMNLRFIYISPSVLRFRGFTAEEVMAQSIDQILTPESLKIAQKTFAEVLIQEENGTSDPNRGYTLELEEYRKDGATLWAEVSLSFLRDGSGRPVGILSVSRDITERKRAEDALRESEERYRTIVETTAEWIWTIDLTGNHTYSNPGVTTILGYFPEEIIGKSSISFLHEEDRREVESTLPRLLAKKQGWRGWIMRWRHKDGTYRYLESNASPVINRVGEFIGYLGADRDITERKKAEEALHAVRRRLEDIIDFLPDATFVIDGEKKIVAWNRAAETMTGTSKETMIGRGNYVYSVPFFGEKRPILIDLLDKPDTEVEKEYQFIRREGTNLYAESFIPRLNEGRGAYLWGVAAPLFDSQGNRSGAIEVIRDVTVRKRAEDALRESEERYRSIFETTIEGIYQTTPQGRYLRVNPAFALMLGYDSPEDLIGSITDIGTQVYVNPDRRSEFKRHLSEQDRVENFEAPLYRKDGTTMWGLINAVTVRNENGDILYFTGGMIDITERKGAEIKLRDAYEQLRATDEQMRAQYDSLAESERSLRESEDKYRRLTETAHDVIVSVDLNFKITYVNQATLDLAGGMNPVGMSLLSFTPSHLHELQEAMMQKRREGFSDGTSFEWEVNVLTGKKAIFEIRAALLTKDDKPSGVLFVARDITERKRVEEELRRLSIAVEQAAEDIIITDREGVIQYVNPAFEKITGYSRSEAIGQNPRILKSGVHDAAFYEHLWKTIKRGEIWTGRITNRRKDGILIEEDATICPLLTSAGMLTGYVALKRDVTEAVQLEAQFRQSQKMEAVGQLAGGVAHDFNNILQAILGYTDIVLYSLGPDDKNRAKLMEVYKAGQRAAALTQQLLAFSRRQVLQLAPLDLNQAIEDLMRMLRHLIGENIELHITPCRDLLTVNADRGQIEQVVMNLCLNARDAMAEGGRLSIETGNILFDARYCTQHEWAKPGWYVLLTITDSGCGMDEETRGKIFEPFFTTKEPDRGTGLGLSTVYGIVRQHNGMIEVYSEPGKGSRFSVYLPAIERAETVIIPEWNKQIPGGNETILLAEDNEQVRHLAVGILERSGYKVLTAVDGEEALLVYQTYGKEIDLLLLDVVMPKKGGRNVYDEIRSIRSDVRCLFISGYSVNAVHTNFILDQGLHLIQKPFKNDDLLRAVRQTLDRS